MTAKKKRETRIVAQPGMDPSVCRFIVDRPIYPDRAYNCSGPEAAKGSPLLEALFKIDGVNRVFVSGEVIVVAKDGDQDWKELGKTVGAVIRRQVESGKKLIVRDDSRAKAKEAEIRRQVEELFEKQLNPGLASHGGFVKLEEVKGSVVYISMGGGCQGCGAAKMTLKMGIERSIFAQAPQVTEVVDVTDHAAGTKPYYDKAPDAK